MTTTSSAFTLPDRLAAKGASSLIAADARHFQTIVESLQRATDDLSARLDVLRKAPGGGGQDTLERDLEIHRLTSRRRALGRYGRDLCLGRMVEADSGETIYVGRFGLTDSDGRRLLLDWRSPAAEPFFGATHARPMGLSSRRRYRWTRGAVTDYWDEVFTLEDAEGHAALDDQSAFIASLGSSRSSAMRDVLGTIQADQDAIIRAGSRGALVVDGGPGTGKTVVAFHRTAYLLYSDPRLGQGHGGVLFVGPHPAYLAYVADVLPSLGEDSVQTCTLRDFVPEGAAAAIESDPEVERIKSTADVVTIVEAAIRHYERLPARGMTVETHWADVWLDVEDWAEAFAAAEPGMTHNDARERVWEQLLTIIIDNHDDDAPAGLIRRSLLENDELRAAFNRAWPLVDPVGVIADLWSVPAYLRQCAPGLSEQDIRTLQRADARSWSTADLPFLDVARQRAGDPEASRTRARREATIVAERERMSRAIDDLIAADADQDGDGLVTMLRSADVQNSLVDDATLPSIHPDLLAGPFAHIVIDEAQELTDAEWQMLVLRCPSRSFTIVGDRAQARHGFSESWQERLERVGIERVTVASLGINYRTPAEIMVEAEPVILAALPDANVPRSIRSTGRAVTHGSRSELQTIVDAWLTEHAEGVACVIGDSEFTPSARVRSLIPELSKGLEFDLVVLVDPQSWGTGTQGAVDRYVAMTRATQDLVILTR